MADIFSDLTHSEDDETSLAEMIFMFTVCLNMRELYVLLVWIREIFVAGLSGYDRSLGAVCLETPDIWGMVV